MHITMMYRDGDNIRQVVTAEDNRESLEKLGMVDNIEKLPGVKQEPKKPGKKTSK